MHLYESKNSHKGSFTFLLDSGSMPVDGSSSNRTFGSPIKAMARESFLLFPPLYRPQTRSANGCRPTCFNNKDTCPANVFTGIPRIRPKKYKISRPKSKHLSHLFSAFDDYNKKRCTSHKIQYGIDLRTISD